MTAGSLPSRRTCARAASALRISAVQAYNHAALRQLVASLTADCATGRLGCSGRRQQARGSALWYCLPASRPTGTAQSNATHATHAAERAVRSDGRHPRHPLGLDRPQHPRPRAPDAPVLPAAADGLPGGGHPEPDQHRRHVLHQGLSRPVGAVPGGAGLLADPALGAEGAAGAPGRPDLEAQGRAGVPGGGTDRLQPAHHDRPAVRSGGDARRHAGRGLVHRVRVARAGRLRAAGRRGGRHDGRGRAAGGRGGQRR